MRVAIYGDGPAAYLASIVAVGEGAQVQIFAPASRRDAAQSAHVHVIDPRLQDLAASIDAPLGVMLHAASQEDWQWHRIHADGTRQSWRSDRLSRAAVCEGLRSRADDLGIMAVPPPAMLPDADLMIDATGAHRALVRRCEAEGLARLTLYDHGEVEQYNTWAWREQSDGLSQTTVSEGDARLYIQQEGRDICVTQVSCGGTAAQIAAEVTPPSDAFHTRMIGVPNRMLCIDGADVPVIAFGDALIQTSPRLGFGLLSCFQQGALLKQEMGGSAENLRDALSAQADEIWQMLALRDAMEHA